MCACSQLSMEIGWPCVLRCHGGVSLERSKLINFEAATSGALGKILAKKLFDIQPKMELLLRAILAMKCYERPPFDVTIVISVNIPYDGCLV